MPEITRKRGGRLSGPRIADRIATVFLWGLAGLTIGTLLYILGFILYHGFVSDNVIETDVLPTGVPGIAVPWTEEPVTVVVNRDVRLKKLTYPELISLYKGSPANWGNLTEQDMSIQLLAVRDLMPDAGSKVTLKNSVPELLESVASLSGAVGFIPLSQSRELEKYRVKTVPVWSVSLAVNPSVLDIRENTKLRYLDEGLLRRILQGSRLNWKDLGGIDLPLTLILPPEDSPAGEYLAELKVPAASGAGVVRTGSVREQLELLASTSGAVGLVSFQDAQSSGLPTVKYQSRVRQRNLRFSFLVEEPKRAGRVGGISSIIVNTIYMVLLTILVSAPIGVGAAIYLTEYARQGRLVALLRLGTETLAGIPSIIFGLFGFIVFVGLMKLGIGLLSGTLTITLMILPTIIRTSEEAIKSVPPSFREGSLALGAGKWQTIYKVIIPAAMPGIITGIILGMGRAIGETAALLFTMGFDYRKAENLHTSARVLSVHLYQLVKEGISFDRAFATATILILVILGINLLINSRFIRRNKG